MYMRSVGEPAAAVDSGEEFMEVDGQRWDESAITQPESLCLVEGQRQVR